MTDLNAASSGDGWFGGFRDSVYWGWNDYQSTKAGLGCLDLALGGYCRWIMSDDTGGGIVGGIVPFLGSICFTVGANGLYVEQQGSYVSSGFVLTSLSDKQSSLSKVYEQLSVLLNHPLAAGEGLQVAYSLDGGGTYGALAAHPTNILGQAGQKYLQVPLAKKSNAIGLKIILSGPGTSTPNSQLVTVRTRQTGICDIELQLPVNCYDEVYGLDGRPLPENGPGVGAARARALEALAQTRIALQDIDWDFTGNVDVYDVTNVDVHSAELYDHSLGKESSGQTAVMMLRKVSK
jgi:hypothetical protein